MTGLDDILKKMNNAITGAMEFVDAGLVAAAIIVQGDSVIITPVGVTSNLINSRYINEVVHLDTQSSIEIGYFADYADYVHEMPNDTNWKKPTAENKFLEKSIIKNEKKVLQILGQTLSNGLSK